MATAPPTKVDEVRTWLADALEETAEWREMKAEDYPDDTRNGRASRALRYAAVYVRTVEESTGLEALADLVVYARQSSVDPASGRLGTEASRIASRYFFDHQPGEAGGSNFARVACRPGQPHFEEKWGWVPPPTDPNEPLDSAPNL